MDTRSLQRLPDTANGRSRAGHAHHYLQSLLSEADIGLDGRRPWDIQLIDPAMPRRVLAHGSLGLGEAYVDGQWECEHLDQLFDRLPPAQPGERVPPLSLAWHHLRARWPHPQTQPRSWQVARAHYDMGNDFYAAMLDRRMTYTCAFWQNADTLDAAQEHKLDLVCRKLDLRPGMRVLDIGCGWGSFMRFAAERHGVSCVGVTVSAEQVALGRGPCAGLTDGVRPAQ